MGKPRILLHKMRGLPILQVMPDRMRRARVVALAVMLGLMARPAIADLVQDWITLPTEVSGPDRYLVPQSQLSRQATAPFRAYGEVVTSQTDQWAHLLPSVRRFPDTLSYLPEPERAKDPVNLLAFDWNRPPGRFDLDVCMFRILASLGDPVLIADWFRRQGFHASSVTNDVPEERRRGTTRFGFGFIMSSAEFRRLKTPGWLYRLIGIDLTSRYIIEVMFLPDGALGSAGIGSIGE